MYLGEGTRNVARTVEPNDRTSISCDRSLPLISYTTENKSFGISVSYQ